MPDLLERKMVKSMKKPHKSNEKPDPVSANQKIDPTVLTAIIGGIVTVAVALITILPQFLNNRPSQPAEVPTHVSDRVEIHQRGE